MSWSPQLCKAIEEGGHEDEAQEKIPKVAVTGRISVAESFISLCSSATIRIADKFSFLPLTLLSSKITRRMCPKITEFQAPRNSRGSCYIPRIPWTQPATRWHSKPYSTAVKAPKLRRRTTLRICIYTEKQYPGSIFVVMYNPGGQGREGKHGQSHNS